MGFKWLALNLHLLEFDPLRATSYIPLPTYIHSRKAVINIKNKDEKCFQWAVIAGLYGDSRPSYHDRVSHYQKEFNLQGISFPMALKDVPKFETVNNVSISIYGYQEGKEDQERITYPLKVSKEVKDHVNLLLIADDDTNHYCFIKKFGRLGGSQYNKDNHKTYFYTFCLHGFSSHSASKGKARYRRTVEEMEKELKVHGDNCVQHNGCINKFHWSVELLQC